MLRPSDGGAVNPRPKLQVLHHSHPSKRLTFTTPLKHTNMAAQQIPLLDEQDFNAPFILQELPDNDIDKHNNFMWYFHQSQFFEPMCNNASMLNAFRTDPQTYPLIHDRKAFSERLHKMQSGLQFAVVGEPQGEGQPWVYQRQNKMQNARGETEVYVEGNWYNQGTRVMMAPSLLDVVRARLVCSHLTVMRVLKQVLIADAALRVHQTARSR